MQYTRLGTAGVKTSRICLGTNMMGGYVDDQASARLIDTFLDCGGNFIDTADVYSRGKSEEAIGKALKVRRHEAFVATKLNAPMGEGPNDRGNSRSHIMESAEASLKRLQTDYIDLYILHRWDTDSSLAESLRAMDDLVRQGKVRYVGVSNFTAWQVMKALWTADKLGLDPIRSVQVQYSYIVRDTEQELFPMCLDEGLTIHPYWVLNSGMFTGKYQRGQEPATDSRFGSLPQMAQRWLTDRNFTIAEQLEAVARDSGHSPAELTIAWALSKPVIGSVIAGSSRPEQVKANCEAADISLSPESLNALDALGT